MRDSVLAISVGIRSFHAPMLCNFWCENNRILETERVTFRRLHETEDTCNVYFTTVHGRVLYKLIVYTVV